MSQAPRIPRILPTLLISLGGVLSSANAAEYYVANSGNDGSAGTTPETAWQTIAHVNSRSFQPGDSILFRRGDVWRDTLYLHSSGTAEAWITVGAYGTGHRPRILGSVQATSWTQVAANIWRSATSVGNPYQGGYSYGEVFFEWADRTTRWGDQKVYDASFSQMTEEYDWSWHANTLYVYAPADPSSRYAAVEVPQRNHCIRFPGIDGVNVLPKDYVQYLAIDGLELRYAMTHGIYPGYNEIEAHGLTVTHCDIGFIGVRGGSAAYGIAAWHSDMLIQNNVIHDCGRRGVSLNTYTTYTPGLTVSNVTIDGNHFHSGFHTTGPDISTLPGRGHTFTNVTISNNLVDDTGRWAEGINEGCYASSCTSNSIYVEANGNDYSDFRFVGNRIIGSTSRALLLVGIDGVRVYHNSVYASHPGARPYALVLFNSSTGIDYRNNVVYGTLPYHGGVVDPNDARCVMDQGSASFSLRNHNLYHQADSAQVYTGSQYGVGGWDVFLYEWDTWRAQSGFETTSPAPQDPRWVSPATGDVRLQPGSPAIDAGVPIPGFNDGYAGAAPDLGAFEYRPVTLSISDVSVVEGSESTPPEPVQTPTSTKPPQ